MKTILMAVIVLVAVFTVIFAHFNPKATVETPEIKKISDYKRPVREGNCWRQWDTAGNSFLVCH